MGAAILKPSMALSIPVCFLVIAVVVMFYLDLEDYRKIKAVEKRVSDIEDSMRLLKSSMNLKNL